MKTSKAEFKIIKLTFADKKWGLVLIFVGICLGPVIVGIPLIILGVGMLCIKFGYNFTGNCPKCNNVLVMITGKNNPDWSNTRNCNFCKARITLKEGMYEYYE